MKRRSIRISFLFIILLVFVSCSENPEQKRAKHMERGDAYYEKQEYTVKRYEKDGKEMKPAAYQEKTSLPLYPVFDEKGIDRYDTSVVGYESIEGKKCYMIKVTPKEATDRHYKGYYYYDVKDLVPVMKDFTLGRLPFPLKELSIKVFSSMKNGYVFSHEAIITIRVRIPAVVNRRIITTAKTIECKPIMQ